MKNIITLFTPLRHFMYGQNSIDKELIRLNNKTVPYISVQELQAKQGIVVLDAREQKEYDVSHIRNAINVGFNKFDKSKIKRVIDKNTPSSVLLNWSSI
jgi:predicted sulfurtransferase